MTRRQKSERRAFEFRTSATGGINGIVIPYLQVAQVGNFKEVFLPGAITFDDVIANVQHDRSRPLARTGGGGLTLIDSATELRAQIVLPTTSVADDVRELIKRKVLRGLSAEFRVIEDEWQGSERTIRQAYLNGLAVVDRGAYAGATLEEIRENCGAWIDDDEQTEGFQSWPLL